MWYGYAEKGAKWWAGMESELGDEDFTTRNHGTKEGAMHRLEQICEQLDIELEWRDEY